MSSSSSFDFFKRSSIFSMATTVRTFRSYGEEAFSLMYNHFIANNHIYSIIVIHVCMYILYRVGFILIYKFQFQLQPIFPMHVNQIYFFHWNGCTVYVCFLLWSATWLAVFTGKNNFQSIWLLNIIPAFQPKHGWKSVLFGNFNQIHHFNQI